MERGRTNYLRLLGADQRALFEETEKEAPGFAFVVRSMQIDFCKPARMDDVLEIVTAPAEVKGASIVLHQRVMRGDEIAGRGDRAGRLRVRRPRAADPEAAAHRHAGRSGRSRRRLRCCAMPRRRGAGRDVNTLHMSWSKHGGGRTRGYHHGNLKEALIRAALELIAQEGPGGLHLRRSRALGRRQPGGALSAFSRPRRAAGRRRAARLRAVRGGAGAAPGTTAGRIRSTAFDRLGKAYLHSRAPSPPIIRRCSRPAFRSTPIRSCAQAGDRAFAVLRAATETLIAHHAGAEPAAGR